MFIKLYYNDAEYVVIDDDNADGDDEGIFIALLNIDHVALPGKSGAMENWGIITYGEPYLMYNSSNDDLYSGRSVASYIGHELAHFVSVLLSADNIPDNV